MFSPAQPLYPLAGIRAIEDMVMPSARPPLMERAGRAAATEAVRLLMDRPGPILIACGPGNNGGDGFVMARHLLQAGRPVMVAFADDPAKLPPAARAAFESWRVAGGETASDLPAAPAGGWALVVDALFGIGLTRPVGGRHGVWIDALNAQHTLRLAVDIPSGLDVDTGRMLGHGFRATHTVTFIALKPGLLTHDGPDHAGEVAVHRLDLNPAAWLSPAGYVVRPALFADQIRPRRLNSHKGDFGDAAIVGGAPGMAGAALLSGRAALKLGAGRVLVGLLDPAAPPFDPAQPELMLRAPTSLIGPQLPGALAIGPGLGTSPEAAELLHAALALPCPLVLDADALNLCARDPRFLPELTTRHAPTLLTPHPGEAARLLGCDTATIQNDRVQAALTLARRHHAHVVLKGCGSVVATPDGRYFINTSGHPGMATAGMGDVLTGLLAALLAQGWSAEAALLAGVHLHGLAGDRLAREGRGPVGLAAGELADAARRLFNEWVYQAREAECARLAPPPSPNRAMP